MNWSPLANHLWQSTLFGVAILLLTLALRRNKASVRFWFWMAASLKFLLPFSLLVEAGNRIEWRPAAHVAPAISPALEQLGQPFNSANSGITDWTPGPLKHEMPWLPSVLSGIWFIGTVAILIRWEMRWRAIRETLHQAVPLSIEAPIPVMSTSSRMEPGVFGIFSPVLLLPSGIMAQLSPSQLQAILAHELCHVRRKDNLAAALHMLIEAVFWFHPLVWWIGARLIDERERACDEEVLQLGNEPLAYAEGILHVCKFHLESPLSCAAGVTGSDLKRRIEEIMNPRTLRSLTLARKLFLAAVMIVALAGPVMIGVLQAQAPETVTTDSEPSFAVASIKPSDPNSRGFQIMRQPNGGIQLRGITLREMVSFAFDVRRFQVIGGPSWLDSEGYDVDAKLDTPEMFDTRLATEERRRESRSRVGRRMQKLLLERFHLSVHKDTKEMPVFMLTVGKNGHKLTPSAENGMQEFRMGYSEVVANSMRLDGFSQLLSNHLSRTVIDRTGLTGTWDFKLNWAPEHNAPPPSPGERPDAVPTDGPTIFTAVQEQLGLKLENTKGPVEIIVIDRAEKASAN